MRHLSAERTELIQGLQKQVISMQGHRTASIDRQPSFGLGLIEQSFPSGCFPIGGIHEFISHTPTQSAATNGFITALLGKLTQQKGTCIWISTTPTAYPPALKMFGIDPSRILFIDLNRNKEALWVVEEALKCGALTGVVGEFSELGFTESRRLQLAVEESHVTGFIHRCRPRSENTVACLTRWKIRPTSSYPIRNKPGVGVPRWNVELQKVRNGRPGKWEVQWLNGSFDIATRQVYALPKIDKRKTG